MALAAVLIRHQKPVRSRRQFSTRVSDVGHHFTSQSIPIGVPLVRSIFQLLQRIHHGYRGLSRAYRRWVNHHIWQEIGALVYVKLLLNLTLVDVTRDKEGSAEGVGIGIANGAVRPNDFVKIARRRQLQFASGTDGRVAIYR